MTWHIGIDLGTTNSAIASFNGDSLRLHKSPEGNDVTPSAIYFDRRGNKYIGRSAYDNAARTPDQAALRFKRLMGSRTQLHIATPAMSLSPEQCSAEILRTLYTYIPDAGDGDSVAGTVITVPAAFDQVQKEATMAAATLANIGSVALMQEPVAAVMSVMRARPEDSRFLVFDLGGGTLDVALAECTAGRVSLLSHGGVAVCGGRDFDRAILQHIVAPWLRGQFSLPDDCMAPGSALERVAAWAVERAKIDLSSRQTTTISLVEAELRQKDSNGREIYLDVPVSRAELDAVIAPRIEAGIEAARDALKAAGVSAGDVERIVFVGGPTQYKPLRDLVSAGLGIPAALDVNPMTAVAEGAAVFAESMDWSTANRARKSNRGSFQSTDGLAVNFAYTARTPGATGRIVAKMTTPVPAGTEFQVDSIDSGWSSGRMALVDGATVDVPLGKMGENTFKIFLFGTTQHSVTPYQSRLVIVRTAATVEAIPASHPVGVEVLEKVGGRPRLAFLVNVGDALPKTGRIKLKATESLKSGSTGSINIKVWEGDISDPVSDNRFVGVLKVSGTDLDGGMIAVGEDLQCDYEVADSGNISISVSVPSIGATVGAGRNFYSPQDGQVDLSTASLQVAEEARGVLTRLNRIVDKVNDQRLSAMRDAVERATELKPESSNPESNKEQMDTVLQAKRLLADVRRTHLRELRDVDFEWLERFVTDVTRQYARPAEAKSIDGLFESARRAITRESGDFEAYLAEIRALNFLILWRQDWYVADTFKHLAASPHLFTDRAGFEELVVAGLGALEVDNFERLRQIVGTLQSQRIGWGGDDDMTLSVNIVQG